jgi:hypothetical protein
VVQGPWIDCISLVSFTEDFILPNSGSTVLFRSILPGRDL